MKIRANGWQKWIPLNLLMATALTMALPNANAGGISEGGGDLKAIWSGRAWFLGTQPIKTCIEITGDFGISREQAKSDILSAFAVWDRYMTAKRVHRDAKSDPRFRIVSEVDLLPSCDGTQELAIYLGSSSPQIEKVKSRFENPMGFVHRETYDLDTGRSKGFIWITKSGGVLPAAGRTGTPNWNMPYNFHGIALHEVGHVLGVPHIRETVMDDSWLLSRLQSHYEDFRKASFTKVDYLKEIISLPTPEVEFSGFFGPWPCKGDLSSCVPEHKKAFVALTGREPVGKVVQARFIGGKAKGTRLEIKDDQGSVSLALEKLGPSEPTTFILTHDVFSTYRNVHEGYTVAAGHSEGQLGSVDYRTLVAANGARYFAVIERNTSEPTALQVRVMLPGLGMMPAFVADPFQMPY